METAKPKPDSAARRVFVVDDDRSIRTSLVMLLTAQGIEPRPFAEAADVLSELDFLAPGCFLIDLRMPSMSGIDFLEILRERDCLWPAAIMTAHGEIPLAVRAMRLGAIEFLEKPFSAAALEQVLQTAFAQLPEAVARSDRYRAARRVISALSARQLQVFEGVAAGMTSKEIALKHGLSHRTVESYRTDMMVKLGASSLRDLMELKILLRNRFGEN